MPVATPATVAIARTTPEGLTQTVFSCPAHKFATISAHRQNGDEELAVSPAPPGHECKGCLEDWPRL